MCSVPCRRASSLLCCATCTLVEFFFQLVSRDLACAAHNDRCCWQDLGPEQGVELGLVLQAKDGLTGILLRDNSLGPKGGAGLVPAVERGRHSLTALDISLNHVGARGGEALCEALRGQEGMVMINMGVNDIGVAGAKALGEALRGMVVLEKVCVC